MNGLSVLRDAGGWVVGREIGGGGCRVGGRGDPERRKNWFCFALGHFFLGERRGRMKIAVSREIVLICADCGIRDFGDLGETGGFPFVCWGCGFGNGVNGLRS